jgi:hypothetical protein
MSQRSSGVRLALAVWGVWLGAGCSSDAAATPEPTYQTPGAFVAIEEASDRLALLRTLAVIGTPDGIDEQILFVSRYTTEPHSVEEARLLAQRKDLPLGGDLALGLSYFKEHAWTVVWFRTLSSEEQASFR